MVKQSNLYNITIQQNNNLPIRCYKDTEKIEKIKSKGHKIQYCHTKQGAAPHNATPTHTLLKKCKQIKQARLIYIN